MPRSSKSTPFKSQVLSAPPRRTAPVLVASAQNFTIDPEKRTESRWKNQGWQRVIWNYFDVVPEFHYACTWVGNMLSQARLYAQDSEGKELTSGPAFEAMEEFFGGPDGQRQFLRDSGIHLTATGDQMTIGADLGDDETDWLVAPSSETRKDNDSTWRVNDETFAKNPLVIRMWRPHPRNRQYSDCPARACMPILAELDGLTKRVAAQIDSRLASAGILALPNEITFSSTQVQNADGTTSSDNSGQKFVENFLHTLAKGITDPETAAALVPIVLQMPGEYIDKIKLVNLASDLDKQAKELRDESIRRLALGMDMPPEVLEGTADMNHWSSWQVEEAAIKTHSEPLLATIASAVLNGFLNPALVGTSDEGKGITVGVDDTKLRLRPNRSKESLELYDRGLLKASVVLKENGFEESTDQMDDQELEKFLTIAIARGSATPDQVAAAARMLGVNIPMQAAPVTQDTREERPRPSLGQHPVRELPPLSNGNLDAENKALVAGAGQAVHRALERAGNRLRGKAKIHRASSAGAEYLSTRVQDAELGALLEDAWNSDGIAQLAVDLEVPVANLAATLDGYTRSLMITQTPHSADAFREYLTRRNAA